MKIPSIRTVERVVNLIPVVKDLIPKHSTEDSGLLAIIKQQENELHNKKAEICKLREDIEDLKENLTDCIYTINKYLPTSVG